jgi:predicted alpha/beta hydrolase
VLTYDYRGIAASRSGRARAIDATMDDWSLLDAPAAVQLAQSRYPDLPLLLIGHSMGGQAVMMSDIARDAAACAFVGVGSGYWGHCEGRTRASRLGTWNLTFPALLSTLGYVPGWAGMGEDLPAGVASQWRERCLTPTYFEPEMIERVRHNLEQSPARFLSVALTDDDYINPAATADFNQYFRAGQLDFRTITPAELNQRSVGHFKPFRPAAGRALWPIIAEFLEGEVG